MLSRLRGASAVSMCLCQVFPSSPYPRVLIYFHHTQFSWCVMIVKKKKKERGGEEEQVRAGPARAQGRFPPPPPPLPAAKDFYEPWIESRCGGREREISLQTISGWIDFLLPPPLSLSLKRKYPSEKERASASVPYKSRSPSQNTQTRGEKEFVTILRGCTAGASVSPPRDFQEQNKYRTRRPRPITGYS